MKNNTKTFEETIAEEIEENSEIKNIILLLETAKKNLQLQKSKNEILINNIDTVISELLNSFADIFNLKQPLSKQVNDRLKRNILPNNKEKCSEQAFFVYKKALGIKAASRDELVQEIKNREKEKILDY